MNCVYTITHSTGLYYIGSTRDLHKREIEHRSRLNTGRHNSPLLQQAYNIDPTISWSSIPTNSKEEAMELEKQMIIARKDDPLLTNQRHAQLVAPDTREKMRQGNLASWTEERRAQHSKIKTGLKHSEETIQKIRESNKDTRPNELALQMAAEVNSKNVTIDGVFYRTASEAAIAHNVHVSTVLKRVRNPRPQWDNWILV